MSGASQLIRSVRRAPRWILRIEALRIQGYMRGSAARISRGTRSHEATSADDLASGCRISRSNHAVGNGIRALAAFRAARRHRDSRDWSKNLSTSVPAMTSSMAARSSCPQQII
jgi:hypothetical protein